MRSFARSQPHHFLSPTLAGSQLSSSFGARVFSVAAPSFCRVLTCSFRGCAEPEFLRGRRASRAAPPPFASLLVRAARVLSLSQRRPPGAFRSFVARGGGRASVARCPASLCRAFGGFSRLGFRGAYESHSLSAQVPEESKKPDRVRACPSMESLFGRGRFERDTGG